MQLSATFNALKLEAPASAGRADRSSVAMQQHASGTQAQEKIFCCREPETGSSALKIGGVETSKPYPKRASPSLAPVAEVNAYRVQGLSMGCFGAYSDRFKAVMLEV